MARSRLKAAEEAEGRARRRAREDAIPIEHKFGYAAAIEKEEIERSLLRRGVPMPQRYFEIERIYQERHANDPSYAERSAAFRARQAPPSPSFTAEELQHMMEHFAGANDPIAASIAEKAKSLLP